MWVGVGSGWDKEGYTQAKIGHLNDHSSEK